MKADDISIKMKSIIVINWIMLYAGLVLNLFHTSQAKDALLFCTDPAPPSCVRRQPLRSPVCHGENVTAYVELQLPLKVMRQFGIVRNIFVYRGEQLLIQGLDCNPTFPNLQRWRASHTFSKDEGKSGLLTVRIDVHNVQPEDEFETHVEVHTGNQILKTSREVWFTVNDNCSSIPTQPPKSINSIIISKDWMHIFSQQMDELKECLTNYSFEGKNHSYSTSPEGFRATTTANSVTAVLWITSFIAMGMISLHVLVYLFYKSSSWTIKSLNDHVRCVPYIERRGSTAGAMGTSIAMENKSEIAPQESSVERNISTQQATHINENGSVAFNVDDTKCSSDEPEENCLLRHHAPRFDS